MKKLSWVIFSLMIGLFSCQQKPEKDTKITQDLTLEQSWSFASAKKKEWKKATVPGTVHQDLLAHQDIQDPFYSLNEYDVQWVEDEDWIYKTTFKLSKEIVQKENINLLFKGLDTYADIYLNDSLLLSVDNMFRSWQVDIKKGAKEGDNELKIYFHSAVKKGMEKLKSFSYLYPVQNEQAPKGHQTSVYTRKAAYHYGWDWGPRLTTCGIWQKIHVQAWNNASINDIFWDPNRIDSTIAKYNGSIEIKATKELKGELKFSINGQAAGSTPVSLTKGDNVIQHPLDIKSPQLWWPAQYGDQPIYKIKATLFLDGIETDSYERNLAVCDVKVIRTPDETGEGFHVQVNGQPIFMKGANYIPGDNLITRVSDDKYQRVIDEALAANMNSLRVWGGAVYEKDIFYDKCLEHGIMLWHDFMFACSMYPGNGAYLENIKLEAEEQVKRLRNYPNIYVWAGNNEILGAWHGWKFPERFDLSLDDSLKIWKDYQSIFYEVLPNAVKKYHPERLYWASSPQSHENALENGKSGDSHYWGVWFGGNDFESYREETGRFFSEYGFQSYPSMSALRQFTPEEQLAPFSEVLYKRQRSPMTYLKDENGQTIDTANGNHNIDQHMSRYFQKPDTFSHYVYVSQLLHALAVKEASQAHRRNKPHTMGSMYWQINDCWPTISWASIDYYGYWKATHYQARDSYQKYIISPVDEEENINVYVVSDDLKDQQATIQVELRSFLGDSLFSMQKEVVLKGNKSTIHHHITLEEIEQKLLKFNKNEVYLKCQLSINGQMMDDEYFFFTRTKDLSLPKANLNLQLVSKNNKKGIEVTTDAFAEHVYLYHPTQGINFSDNFFHLEKGKKKVVYWEDASLDMETILKELKAISISDTY